MAGWTVMVFSQLEGRRRNDVDTLTERHYGLDRVCHVQRRLPAGRGAPGWRQKVWWMPMSYWWIVDGLVGPFLREASK